MKIPYSWLKDYIDLDGVPVERVAELLTLRTCEVDAVHHVGARLDDIVIGEVIEAEKHPNADSLKVTKVNIGRGELLPIVCGAPNVTKGQKVAVIPPGCKLPNGMEITERKMRGEISRGMICSEKELGLGDDHDGILVLEPEAVVGRKLTSLPSIEDWIIEIDNKSINHRPDLWGIYGFARELGAILQKSCKNYRLTDSVVIESSIPGITIAIDDENLCKRYLGAILENVTIGHSPAWMQRRLRLVGARPISNVVDITNYVMFEIGQPTHAFDLDKIRGGRILVRNASDGEKLVTLDGQTRTLQKTDLVIADAQRAIGLAGVMGGADTEVSNTTKRIFLESANFHAATIRRTASRLGLRSEASTRFEKTLDPLTTADAVAKIFEYKHLGFGEHVNITPRVLAAGPAPARSLTIPLNIQLVRERLSLSTGGVSNDAILNPLHRLGITTKPSAGDSVICEVPSFRSTKDLTEPIDLVEEIARLRGYETVVPEPLSAPVVPPPSQDGRRALIRNIEDRLVNLGFRGLESYSFLSDSLIQQLGIDGEKFVTIKNSLVADQSRMRREVMPSLLALVTKNINHEPDLRLFEVGKGYRPDHPRVDPHIGSKPAEPQEIHSVAGIVASAAPAKGSFNSSIFYTIKGIVDSLLEGAGLRAEFLQFDSLTNDAARAHGALPYLHPKRRLFVGATAGGQHRMLGYLGELHPEAAARLGFSNIQAAGFELDVAALVAACAAAGPRKLVSIPRFPGITVDVALAAPENLSVEALESLVRSADATLCRNVTLFDIYTGSELGAGIRSVAFHVELRSDERTLTDADEAKYLKSLATKAGGRNITLRGWQNQ